MPGFEMPRTPPLHVRSARAPFRCRPGSASVRHGCGGSSFLPKRPYPRYQRSRRPASGLEAKLLVGDVIGVQLGDNKARCRVIWVTGPALPIDAGVANRVGTAVSVGAAAG